MMVAPIDGGLVDCMCPTCRKIRDEAREIMRRTTPPFLPYCKTADDAQRHLARIVTEALSEYAGVEVLPSPAHEIRVRTRVGSHGGWVYTTFDMETKP